MRALWLLIAIASAAGTAGAGERRFPPPEFDTGYAIPSDRPLPAPRDQAAEYRDVVGLFMALSLATVLALLVRSRRWIVAVMLVFLVWFGLVRRGCICPIGAIQDVSEALLGGGYAVPLTVAAFFLIPLVFAALFGRTFCGAVCPLGAVQDLVALKPVKVPAAAEHALGLLRYVYLAAAVVLAVTGSAYLICRYDPFVGLFRLSASAEMLLLAGCVLAVGVFVARPYCRYICPYGAILGVLSRLSWRHATITPDECIRCRLCEDSCPFGAIDAPTEPLTEPRRRAGRRRLALLLLLAPVLVIAGGWGGGLTGAYLATAHLTVRTADRVRMEETGQVTGTDLLSDAFRATGRSRKDLYADAVAVRAQFDSRWALPGGVRIGWAHLMGGFIGLVVAAKLIALSIHRTRTDYVPNRARCLSCGRCFSYCPKGRKGGGRGGRGEKQR
ncbi:MAG TPA: 4Fe-4S binding protein [Phycisphaerae bacterium]|nr:4Fe-4S binding protein [Phycisphaerae bacterium]